MGKSALNKVVKELICLSRIDSPIAHPNKTVGKSPSIYAAIIQCSEFHEVTVTPPSGSTKNEWKTFF